MRVETEIETSYASLTTNYWKILGKVSEYLKPFAAKVLLNLQILLRLNQHAYHKLVENIYNHKLFIDNIMFIHNHQDANKLVITV